MEMQQVARRWFWATTKGWWLGIPVVVLLALASDAVGIEGGQAIVGLGMGGAVGWLQRGLLRDRLPGWRRWAWASALGLGLPFAAADLLGALGLGVYSLPLAAALGALVLGAWQARLLRPWLGDRGTGGWVLACLLGWTLATVAAAEADQLVRSLGLRGLPGALAFLALAAGGGPLLGWITGGWLRRGPADGPPARVALAG